MAAAEESPPHGVLAAIDRMKELVLTAQDDPDVDGAIDALSNASDVCDAIISMAQTLPVASTSVHYTTKKARAVVNGGDIDAVHAFIDTPVKGTTSADRAYDLLRLSVNNGKIDVVQAILERDIMSGVPLLSMRTVMDLAIKNLAHDMKSMKTHMSPEDQAKVDANFQNLFPDQVQYVDIATRAKITELLMRTSCCNEALADAAAKVLREAAAL